MVHDFLYFIGRLLLLFRLLFVDDISFVVTPQWVCLLNVTITRKIDQINMLKAEYSASLLQVKIAKHGKTSNFRSKSEEARK